MSCLAKWAFPLSHDTLGQRDIAAFMLDCFNALDTFGKTPDQIKSCVKMHMLVMRDYPAILVAAAYKRWIDAETELPKPADIKTIIEEDNHRLLDLIGYVRLGAGRTVTAEAEDYVISKLGADWRKKYV